MLCITTVVDSAYMAYVPMFVWCCRAVYPEHHIKLFLRDECPYPVSGAELVPMFRTFPRLKYNSIALRFVVPPEQFEGFDAVYVTDIDMMIMPERIPLDDFHRHEMLATSLCYSNSLRNVHHYQGYQSLTGLHYATQVWFDKTEDERAKYYQYLRAGLVGLYREYDGVMLYRMARNAGIGIPGKFKLKKRHHGIHLGNFRLFSNKADWRSRMPSEYLAQWRHWECESDFRKIIEKSRGDNADLNTQMTLLDDFIRNPED